MNTDVIFLGACSLLTLKATRAEDGSCVISKPEDHEIKAAVRIAKRVWQAVADERKSAS
jgi:hypothetical protein